MQRTGSFKFRGALNAIKEKVSNTDDLSLTVVTHSSGNHAAAVALAARLSSTDKTAVSATIVMPNNAPAIKVAGVKGFGGTIVPVENTPDAREVAADEILKTSGGIFVHPSEDPRVIAGQGTVSLELVAQVKELGHDIDAVIIPVGGGGLASGNTIALRGLLGDTVKIILAEPVKLNDAKRSFESGQLQKHPPGLNTMDSVADGLRTTLGPNTWPIIRDFVDDIITVSEEDILKATKMVWERLKVCIEPSAGVGVAVAMGDEFNQTYPVSSGIRNVAVILCGGNVDIIKTAKQMEDIGL
jgi:threonine dehydratase